ncbi:NAD(P)/FAD-dependent oxidoreductase [Solibacillus sp. A46]|uniref:NAD(P)/FAD-dependent oxidoreductase n=1 Tax=Solibacillus faecavium TaxID=2762221 RepID=A0ABR8XWE6_9BACL|nr:NAD(P)/FAD-dependent oxidoreductase [Solibacillus faecavium]MBD8036245.1 NAD(P)/FAD-dependent oxidoreductase [Solibacillus faecavium]
MIYDVCVIGGGPAGMFSAFYSASRRMNTVLIEGNHELGGRLNLFLDYEIYDIPGQFGVLARDYKRALIEQLKVSRSNLLLGEIVEKIENSDELFYVTTTQQTILAKTIIAATGNGFSEAKRIEHAQISKKIQYDQPAFKQYEGPIAVIGHTPMAADWAIQLMGYGNEVTLYTQQELKIQPILMDGLANNNILIYKFSEFNDQAYEAVFCHIGSKKYTIDFKGCIAQRDNGLTNCRGYFVAGEARYEQGKLKLIHGATHDAMQAVNAAFQYIHEGATYQPIVSTHDPIFKEWLK